MLVEEAIKERDGGERIAKDLAPLGEPAVRREDHGAALVSSVDELEEQIVIAWNNRQVVGLVDDQE